MVLTKFYLGTPAPARRCPCTASTPCSWSTRSSTRRVETPPIQASWITATSAFSEIRRGFQIDERGYLANWMVPGQMVPGMGGAMDLVAGARRVIAAIGPHREGCAEDRARMYAPLTAARQISLIVTELAVLEPTAEGLVLRERGPGATVEQVISATAARLIVPDDVREMSFD